MSKWNEQAGRLRETVVDFLWDQWIALGVAGRGTGAPVPFVVDPEVLLLATMRFGMAEPRLVEEVLDWLALNGGSISLQRLKNLQTSVRVGTREGLEELGRFMEELGHFMEDEGFRNWKSVQTWAKRNSQRSRQSWMPNGLELRGMSQRPDPGRPEAFVMRLRWLLGVSARPEVITWLLTHRSGHAAEIARETGWFSKSVQAILNDLELAGMVESDLVGKRKVISINPRDKTLGPGLGDGLRWLSQGPFYLALYHASEILQRLVAGSDVSEGALAIAIRQNMTSMNAAFRLADVDDPFAGGGFLAGSELMECFEEGVERLIKGIKERVLG